MAEYNPSKIIKDGNTYNFRDNTKIPLSGSNQISGSLIPATDNSIDVGSSTKNIKMLYTKGIIIDGKTIDTDANGNMTFDGNKVLTNANNDVLPVGSYIQFAGSQAPAGFLVCNGGAISRTTYSALFAVIGTTYGSGDGSTTFNLPNLTDRFLQGSSTSGTVKNAGLPNITGYTSSFRFPVLMGTGGEAFNLTEGAGATGLALGSGDNDPYYVITFDASRSNSTYGNSTTVQPPALTCLICIKY